MGEISVESLLGLSEYDRPSGRAASTPSLGSPEVDRARRARGGQLAPPPQSKPLWDLADLDYAERAADAGDLSLAARLMKAAVGRDGVLSGVLSTLTDGLLSLPKSFSGADEIIAELESRPGGFVRSTFDEMFPPNALSALASDGLLLGVGVGELRPVPGRDHPSLARLDPENLRFDWNEGHWWFRTAGGGEIPVLPGYGRWVLHTPGGHSAPWNGGKWKAVGRAFINKENATYAKARYEATLANPAIVAQAPKGASQAQTQAFFERLPDAWGYNTVLGLPAAYEVKLLESNGTGHQIFAKTIADCNEELIICIGGSTVPVDGGKGFSSSDIHKSIAADRIQSTAKALAYTLNSQGLPGWIVKRWGPSALANPACVSWDTTPPRDRAQDAASLVQYATAIKAYQEIYGDKLDLHEFAERAGVPLKRQPTQIEAVPAPALRALPGGAK